MRRPGSGQDAMTDLEEIPIKTWDAAFEVARHFHAFGSYGSERKAVKALRRRCLDLTQEAAEDLLTISLTLYRKAIEVVAAESVNLHEQWRANSRVDVGAFEHVRTALFPASRRQFGTML